jgi:exosortase A
MASILGHGEVPAATRGVSGARHAAVLAAALAVVGILAVYADTAASIVAIWWRSQTFAHGFVVVPISLWLVWRDRATLAEIPARPWWPGLLLVLLAGAMWFAMAVGDVLGLRQFALVFMLQAAVVTVVGPRLARALAFPLLFLLFAVPAGEFLLPTLIDRTADFTVAALRASGVPVFREANHFVIPSGAWSVVEACSGLRYLIASVMIGIVYAAVSYRSPLRRAAFIAASIVVPIVANWLRAYMIVMMGHLSNNKLAVGVDHLIYGWLFFGLVMALLFWVGSFWAEDDAPELDTQRLPVGQLRGEPAASSRLYAAAIAAVAVAALWRPVLAAVDRPQELPAPKLAAVAGAGGWRLHDAPPIDWRPSYSGFAAEMRQAYARDGAVVGLHIDYYRNQVKGRELVTSNNQLVAPKEFRWRELASGEGEIRWDGAAIPALRATIASDAGRFTAWRLFWVDGHVTGSEYAAKAWLAWSRVRGQTGDAALIVAFAPVSDGRDAARDALEALAPEIERQLDAARSSR